MAGLIPEVLGDADGGLLGAARGGRMSAPRRQGALRLSDRRSRLCRLHSCRAAGSQHGARILLIDRRPHIGGNAYDEPNEAGILYHKYGPHIFHTNSEQVVDYLSQFTEWRPYEHRVLRRSRGQLVPIPINRTTLNELFGARPRDRRGGRRLPRLARRAGRRHPDLRGRRRQRRRARALRAVLPRLYAQAMGPRPERARQVGHRAHSDPDQHRRPLFHRHLPGHAGATATPRCSRRCSTTR